MKAKREKAAQMLHNAYLHVMRLEGRSLPREAALDLLMETERRVLNGFSMQPTNQINDGIDLYFRLYEGVY